VNLEVVNTYEGTHDVHALILGRAGVCQLNRFPSCRTKGCLRQPFSLFYL
jgi:hypothetical protein